MKLDQKPELLAPAGTLETVSTVMDAGADAVYIGGKQFNMRMHRSSYNLTNDEIQQAITLAHNKGKKLYITLNNMIYEEQISEVRDFLKFLRVSKPDAIIVQDLGVVSMAREHCVQIPLHASTMMNIHSIESAQALKLMGFSRIVASRDIPIHEVRRIGEAAGMEMEYFIHGDMCIAQGSQCHLSGITTNESANCGRCSKSCRWEWELVQHNETTEVEGMTNGYLLARKDLCMLQHIPKLVQNNIVSLKIEGRMRTGDFLAPIVQAYREAIDHYFDDPIHYATNFKTMNEMWDGRVRDFSTSLSLYNSNASSIDPTGLREPRFFSISTPPPELTVPATFENGPVSSNLELIAHVHTQQAAVAALKAGANAIYIGGDEFVRHPSKFDFAWLHDFAANAYDQNVRVSMLGARISDECEMEEWIWVLKKLRTIKHIGVGVSNLGALHVAREMKFSDIVSDFSFNVANSVAADELSTMGARRITSSIELNFNELHAFVSDTRLPVEVIGQGPLSAMLLEHCVIAAATGDSPEGVCPMNCRKGRFGLRDKSGKEYQVEADRRCRNHLLSPTDVCVLPNIALLASTGIAAIRIESQFDTPQVVKEVVSIYREAIDTLKQGGLVSVSEGVDRLCQATGRMMSDGPYAFDRATVIKERENAIA